MIAYVPATTRMVQPQTLELDSGGVCDRLRLCGRVVGSATERKKCRVPIIRWSCLCRVAIGMRCCPIIRSSCFACFACKWCFDVSFLCSAQSLLAGTALTCLLLTLFASAFGAVVGVLGCSGMVAL